MTGPRPGGDGLPAPEPLDIRQEMLDAATALAHPGPMAKGSMTSDLSIDEEFTLHSIGWEPLELVCGVSLHAVPTGVWNWGQGEITYASEAFARSFAAASDRIHAECAKAGGHGVVGVRLSRQSFPLGGPQFTALGTAIRAPGAPHGQPGPFTGEVSGQDFAKLIMGGWVPAGLVLGISIASRGSLASTRRTPTAHRPIP